MAMVGHNKPPAIDFEIECAGLVERQRTLLAMRDRLPPEVTEDNAPRMGAAIKQLTGFIKQADAERKQVKQPYLDAGREIDTWFKNLVSDIEDMKRDCTDMLTAYQRAVAEAERRAREREAKIERERQEQIQRDAQAAEHKARAEMDAAAAAEARATRRQAEAAAQAAERKAKEDLGSLTKTGVTGRTSARLQTRTVCTEWDRWKIDLEALRPYLPAPAIEQAIKAHIRAGNTALTGAVIEEQHTSVVR